ncbi:MAG: 2,3-bisphosphoglycerate-independent phosphoglycerate mutase [bacterium]
MKPLALIVLDGWGYREEATHNAVATASTPVFDRVWKENPHTLLEASGEQVGLPEGQIGNSEIGHTTIGAGKVMATDLVRITKAGKNGEFTSNPVFTELFDHVKSYGTVLHVLGQVSAGGVHSHQDHLFYFLRAAKEAGVQKIAIHAYTDGRDVPPKSGAGYMKELEALLAELGIGHIATVTGRYYAMDRDNNWHRLAKAEAAMFEHAAPTYLQKPSAAMEDAYGRGKVDEHLEPMVFADEKGNYYPIAKDDAVFVFNYRSDRVRMLTRRLLERGADLGLLIATMTEYHPDFQVKVAFPPTTIETTLGAEVARAGLTQAHIAETEKFPHATYFLNGGKQEPHEGEEHVMLDSRKDVATHDEAPEMRAEAIADAAVDRLQKGADFIFINFANPDMVGHTANVPAIVTALETVDRELAKVLAEIKNQGGVALVTADHGNAEINIDPMTGERHTAHTLSLVPFIVVGAEVKLRELGGLSDIAPTALELLGIQKPSSMTGESLIVK